MKYDYMYIKGDFFSSFENLKKIYKNQSDKRKKT